MFDKTVHVHAASGTAHHRHTHVEHRAPTDKSVELLKEMESAARGKVIESISVATNLLNCSIQLWRDAMSDEIVAEITSNVNGKRFTFTERQQSVAIAGDPRAELIQKIHKTLSERLAAEVVGPAFAHVAFQAGFGKRFA